MKDTEDKLDDFIIRLLDNEIFIRELRGDVPKVNVTSAKQKVLKRIEESEQDVT